MVGSKGTVVIGVEGRGRERKDEEKEERARRERNGGEEERDGGERKERNVRLLSINAMFTVLTARK